MMLLEWIMGVALLFAAGILLAGCKESENGEGDGDVEEEEGDADAADHDADAPDRPDDTVVPDDVPVDDVKPDDGVTPDEVEEDAAPPDVPEEEAVEDPVEDEVELDIVPDPEPEPDIVPDPEPEPEIVPDPEPEPDIVPDPEPEPDIVPDPEPDPDIVPDPDAEPDIPPDPEPEPDLTESDLDLPEVVPSMDNWDLEDWTTTNPPPGFEKATAAELANYTMTQSTQNHTPGGQYSAELTWTTQNNVDIHPQYRYPVTAGMQYSCHGWFLDSDSAGRLRFFIGWYDAAEVLTRDFPAAGYTADSAAWQELVYQSTAPATAVAMICGIRLYDVAATWDGNATIYFDDLSITQP